MSQQTIITFKNIASKYSLNFVANAFQQGFRFLLLYLAAKLLGPADFAVVSLILLVSSYLLNANLGAVNGLKKQIPLVYLNKPGDQATNAFFSILNFNLVATLAISIGVAIVLNRYYNYSAATCIVLVLLCLVNNVYFSVQTYFTSTGKWKELSKLQLVCALFLVIAIISLIYGNYLLLLTIYTGSFFLASLQFFFKYGYRSTFDKATIKENVGIGFPVMVAGFIFLLFQTTDRLIISQYYKDVDFAYYSFAWVFENGSGAI